MDIRDKSSCHSPHFREDQEILALILKRGGLIQIKLKREPKSNGKPEI